MANEDKMPLFLINGFLEAGKPSLLNLQCDRIISRPKAKHLIVCEEGEEEYDEEL